MKKLGPILIIAVVLAGTAALREWHQRQGEPGNISFQFVPKQRDSPIAVLSWTLEREHLWTPWIQVRNDANVSLDSVTPVVVVATPTSVQRVDLPAVAARVAAGLTARFQVELPERWPDGPWQSYTTGAVVTLAFASARFADGTRWELAASARDVLAVSPEVDVKLPEGGLIASRLLNFAGEMMLSPSLSEYPINSALTQGACVMSACGSAGRCEYDGCQIVR